MSFSVSAAAITRIKRSSGTLDMFPPKPPTPKGK